jgi:hypothetical protein
MNDLIHDLIDAAEEFGGLVPLDLAARLIDAGHILPSQYENTEE